MKGAALSILVTLGIILGMYYFYFKTFSPEGNVQQTISTTGVEMDLTAIAQAERMYYVQNGAYGSMDQLTSTSTMNINSGGRDGYSYSVEPSGSGFTITATHPDVPVPPGTVGGASPVHYPTLSIDENMQVRHE